MATTKPTLLSQTRVRTPLVFFSTQATAPLRIKRPMQLAITILCGSSRCQWRQQNRHYCRKLKVRTPSVFFSTQATAPLRLKVTYATGDKPRLVAAADVDGDNKPDIIVANCMVRTTVGVLLNTGNGTFATQTTYATGS